MKAAYIDTSCLVAILFEETSGTALARRLEEYDELFSSNLLEAELRSVAAREGVALEAGVLDAVSWIFPDRPLTSEMGRALSAGYVRGADLWHLACALFLADAPADIAFLTLDERQRAAAERLGFAG